MEELLLSLMLLMHIPSISIFVMDIMLLLLVGIALNVVALAAAIGRGRIVRGPMMPPASRAVPWQCPWHRQIFGFG